MCKPWARPAPRKVKLKNKSNVKVLGSLAEKAMTMVVGGEDIVFSTRVATGLQDGKKAFKEKERKRLMDAKL